MSDDLNRDLASLISEGFRQDEPGVAIGLFHDGQLVASACRGLASLEHGISLSESTIFDVASVSKQMTATCALLLAREGLVDLDEDIRTVVPELRIDEPVSFRQCLNHSAGLRDYLAIAQLTGRSLGTLAGEREFLAWLAQMRGTDFRPGTNINLSNTGYVIAATAIRRATGQSFATVLTERILEPLGMMNTRIRDEVGKVIPGMAFSYRQTGGGFVRQEMLEAQVGDRGVMTTLHDLAAWQGFLVDGRILGRQIRDELLKPSVLADGTPVTYGLGLFNTSVDDTPVVSHSGAMYGFRSVLVCAPEKRTGVAVLSNRSTAQAEDLGWDAMRLLGRDRVRTTSLPKTDADAEGLWYAPSVNECLELDFLNGDLRMRKGPSVSVLEPVGLAKWMHPTGSPTVSRIGQELVVVDRLGRHLRYHKAIVGSPPDPGSILGRYHSSELDGEIVIVQREDRLFCQTGKLEALPMAFMTTSDGDPVYVAGRLWLRFHLTRNGTEVTLSFSRAQLRRIPRIDA